MILRHRPLAADGTEYRAADYLRRQRRQPLLRPDRLVLRARRNATAGRHRLQPAGWLLNILPHIMTGLTKNEVSWRISDHYPLWAEFRLDGT